MKEHFHPWALVGLLFVVHNVANAQDASVVTPAAYGSTLNNYIRSWTAAKPDTADADITISCSLETFRMTTQYLDGLGKPIQTITKEGSLTTGSTAVDLVTAEVYDNYDREPRIYLPFAANSTGGNTSISDGHFKTNPFQQQNYFYSNSDATSPIYGQGENYYYSKTEYEPSALNRPLRSYGAGDNWVHNGNGVKYAYEVNTTTDSVEIIHVTDTTQGFFGRYTAVGQYVAGDLSKTITTDENGHQVIQYQDKQGRTILKKVQNTAATDNGSGSGPTGWLCTYYIYDYKSQLRAVIQPAGVIALLAGGWSFTTTILYEQLFRYEYDTRVRMIIKKVPGAAETDMVYDAKDRLVLTQDGNLQTREEYLFTQYDTLDRIIATGVMRDPTNYSNPNYHRALAATSTSYPNLSGYTDTLLIQNFYDNLNWLSTYGNPLGTIRSTGYDPMTQTPSNTTYPYPQPLPAPQSTAIQGLLTGIRANIVGTNTYLYTTYFYDDYHRVVQSQRTNISGGADVITTQYTFTGQPLVNVLATAKASPNSGSSIVLTQYVYDSLGRVQQLQKKVSTTEIARNWFPSTWETAAQYQYDALGRVTAKNLGQKPGYSAGTPLTNQQYVYNIRGWLLSINHAYVDASTNSDQYFGMEMGYDKNADLGTFSPIYNGNISGMIWKGEGDQAKRKYDFTYDATNRLTAANFNQYVSGTGTSADFDKSAGIDFSVSGLSYDPNGNILGMLQKGWMINSSQTIDSLSYSYQSGSNKLAKVSDGAVDTAIQLGDFRDGTNTGNDYSYDVNGNLLVDSNKNISSITYNIFNMPNTIHFKGKGTITYTYDAAGTKLSKIVVDSTVAPRKIDTTMYFDGAEYINDTLQFLVTEDGRIRPNIPQNLMVYDYFMKDHLGDTRLALTEEADTNAYPDASLEDSTIANQRLYYAGVDTGRVNKSTVPGYPNDTYTNPNNYIQQLSGGTGDPTVGTNIVLRVMAGDTIDIRANSWYNNYGASPGIPTSPLSSLILGLAGGVSALDPGHLEMTALQQPGVLNPGISNFLTTVASNYNTLIPKAFLNWILLDDQFNYVAGSGNTNSGFRQVGADTTFTTFTITDQLITKSGFLFIYVSNETPNINVYFDNLQVTHIRGRIMEENHYYPFGLTMAGISSQAATRPENFYKFNKGSELQHKEFSDGTGLEWYATEFRTYDVQVGRWDMIDPKANAQESPFAAMQNNPEFNNDPLGDTVIISWVTGSGKKAQTLQAIYNDGKLYNSDGSLYNGKVNGLLGQAVNALNAIAGTTAGSGVISSLTSSTHNFTIKDAGLNNGASEFIPTDHDKAYAIAMLANGQGNPVLGGTGGTIYWNTAGTPLQTVGDSDPNPTTDLAHELFHGYEANSGSESTDEPIVGSQLIRDEYRASYFENQVRSQIDGTKRSGYTYNGITVNLLDAKGNPINVPSYPDLLYPFLIQTLLPTIAK